MGRTAYMDGIRSAYKCFTGNSEENRSLGRLWSRWEYTIKICITYIV